MRVFISWSGRRSQAAARALRHFLIDMFDDVEPWLSSIEIKAGERWASTVGAALAESDFGILCCTRDSVLSPWLLFEAGALAKSLDNSMVVPYLIDIPADDLSGPIKQFQGVNADVEGTWHLIKSINSRRLNPRDEGQLRRQFDRWWEDIRASLDDLPESDANTADPMQEILRYARDEAQERAARRGAATWTKKDGPVEEVDDLMHPPRIDRWSALILDEIMLPLVDYRNSFAEMYLATEKVRNSFEQIGLSRRMAAWI